MNYLLLGGSGFIGKHLANRLKGGNNVVVVDNCSTSTPIEGVTFYQADLQDFDKLEELVEWSHVVYFLAGSVGVKNVVENPYDTLVNNMTLPMKVVPIVARYSKKFIFSSTSEVYGNGPFVETNNASIGSPDNLRWGYASAKLTTEFLVASSGVPYRIVRFFNIVGPGQLGDYGMVLPRFVQAARNNEPIYVYGDGSQFRSFCHIDDALEMLREIEGSQQGVYNVGNDHPVTILDLAHRVKELLGSDSEIIVKPLSEVYKSNYGDIHARIPDLTKLHKTILHRPSKTLDDIILDINDSF